MTSTEFKNRFLPLHKELYRVAVRMLGDSNEAEDAVQNLFVKLWERRDTLGSIESDEAYCRQLLKNICIDRWRKMRTRDEEVDFVEEISEANAPPDVEGEEAEEFVEHFLATLPQRQQRVMTMQMQGSSIEEIAKVTELTEGNVKVMLSRIRKRFRELYYKR